MDTVSTLVKPEGDGLEEGVDTVSTLVKPEGDGIKENEWKVNHKVKLNKWEARAAITEINLTVS